MVMRDSSATPLVCSPPVDRAPPTALWTRFGSGGNAFQGLRRSTRRPAAAASRAVPISMPSHVTSPARHPAADPYGCPPNACGFAPLARGISAALGYPSTSLDRRRQVRQRHRIVTAFASTSGVSNYRCRGELGFGRRGLKPEVADRWPIELIQTVQLDDGPTPDAPSTHADQQFREPRRPFPSRDP